MKIIRHTYLKALLLLTLIMLGGKVADAADRIYVEDFTVESYDTRRVNVMFEFDSDISGLNFDIVLPQGLSMVGEPTRNPEVFATGQAMRFNSENNRVLVISTQRKTFIGKTGVLCTFNVKADPGTLESNRQSILSLSDIALTTPEAKELTLSDAVAKVSFQSAKVAATASEQSFVINPGGSREIGIGMENSVTAAGVQVEVRLPDGFTVKNEAFNLTSRGSNGALVSAYPLNGANGYRLVVADFSGSAAINGNSGDFVKFEVIAPIDFEVPTASIEVSGLKISSLANQSFSGTPCSIQIVNGNDAYLKAMAEVGRLEKMLDDALVEIASVAPDVKEDFSGSDIAADIQGLKDAIKDAYDSMSLTSDYSQVMAPVQGIETAIAKLISDAKAAQQAYEEEQAAEAARQEAYRNANAIIESLETKLAEALSTIAVEAPDVKDSFKGTEISSGIEALKVAVEKAYNDKTIVADYDNIMAPAPSIESAISKLVADAKAAQQAYEEEQAAEAARQEAYRNANAMIESLETKLAEALSTIAAEAPDVKDSFKGTEIKIEINILKAAVEKAYNDKTIVADYDNIMAPAPSIESAISKLVADAKAAQQAYDEEQAAEAARQDAYRNANAMIESLETKLAEALSTIAVEAPDVKDSFKGTDIKVDINALKTAVQNAYQNKTIVADYDTLMAPASAIESAISQLVDDAKAAQKTYEENEALASAFDKASTRVSDLEKALSDALAVIATTAPDVKNQFSGSEITLQIVALREEVRKAFNDKTLVDKYDEVMTPAASIEAAISKLIEDAKAAQKAYEEEQTAEAARQEAYRNANAMIESLETKLAEALSTIAVEAPDVKDSFKGIEITADINALKASVEKAYNDKTIASDYDNIMMPASSIETAISKLVADAKAAQQSYEKELERQAANLAAYEADLKVIEGLQTKLDQTVDNIRMLFPDFDVDMEKKSVQDAIDRQRKQADDAYAAVASEGHYENTVETASIEQMISALLAEAQKSGVEQIFGDDIENVAAIYNVHGNRLVTPERGKINIVVFKDGTTRKVYVR